MDETRKAINFETRASYPERPGPSLHIEENLHGVPNYYDEILRPEKQWLDEEGVK